MIEITVLGSGSSGNATLIRSENTAILIDAGFSCRQLTLRLEEAGWSPDRLDAVVISHEHTDHVQGLRVLNRKHPVTVYASARTLATKPLEEAELTSVCAITSGVTFSVGDLTITPFSIPHDAADPLAFVVEADGVRIGHMTDAGFVTELAKHHLKKCHALVLESNHDRDMLINGSYPWPIKQRIMSRSGHLSNPDAGMLLSELMHPDLRYVFLAHLSRENNTHDLAEESALGVIRSNGGGEMVCIHRTYQDRPSDTVAVVLTDITENLQTGSVGKNHDSTLHE